MLPVNQFVKGKYVVIVSAKVYAWRVRILGLILRLFFRTDEISLRCHEDTRRNFADGWQLVWERQKQKLCAWDLRLRWIGETGLTMAGLTIIRERLKKMRESSLGAIETDVCGTWDSKGWQRVAEILCYKDNCSKVSPLLAESERLKPRKCGSLYGYSFLYIENGQRNGGWRQVLRSIGRKGGQ